MFRKSVKCCNCGFLSLLEEQLLPDEEPQTLEDFKYLRELEIYGYHECGRPTREYIAKGTLGTLGQYICSRHVWHNYELSSKKKEEAAIFLNSSRKCPYFFKYSPGNSPLEHKELQREDKTQKLIIVSTLLGALIGAVAAIVAQLIAG
jgi:hypothetical protein